MALAVDGLASKPYPGGRSETGFGSTLGSLEYEDVYTKELPGLPP